MDSKLFALKLATGEYKGWDFDMKPTTNPEKVRYIKIGNGKCYWWAGTVWCSADEIYERVRKMQEMFNSCDCEVSEV